MTTDDLIFFGIFGGCVLLVIYLAWDGYRQLKK